MNRSICSAIVEKGNNVGHRCSCYSGSEPFDKYCFNHCFKHTPSEKPFTCVLCSIHFETTNFITSCCGKTICSNCIKESTRVSMKNNCPLCKTSLGVNRNSVEYIQADIHLQMSQLFNLYVLWTKRTLRMTFWLFLFFQIFYFNELKMNLIYTFYVSNGIFASMVMNNTPKFVMRDYFMFGLWFFCFAMVSHVMRN
jgi:hypothetical protein